MPMPTHPPAPHVQVRPRPRNGRRNGPAGWRAIAQILVASLILSGGCSGELVGEDDDTVREADGGARLDGEVVGRDGGAPRDGFVPAVDGGEEADAGGEPPDAGTPAPVCGDGVIEGSEECDDGNTMAGDECSPSCRRSYACGPLPIACGGAQPATTEHHLVAAEPCSFGLVPTSASAIAQRRELIAALVARSGGRVSMSDVLGDLNRQGTSGISSDNAYRLRNHDFGGFRWNSGDEGVTYWYPQGITGTSDAEPGGRVGGRNAVLVSWYHKTDARPTKGVRVSLADITNLSDVDYRHLLLVQPTGTPTSPDFGPVETGSGNALHAGGIVWWGDLLYVADTTGGLRVFDLANVMRVPNTDDTNRIGISGGRFDAHGYRYAIPELMRFRRHGDSCTVRFSFVGLDRSSTPPALVTGEYRSDDIGGRIVVWDLDPATGLLDVRSGEVRASAAYVSGQTRMQGAIRYEGNIYISSSSQYERYGRLYRTRPGFGASSITAWVYGAEDLYIDRAADRIWTAAEHPGNRDTVGIPIRRP